MRELGAYADTLNRSVAAALAAHQKNIDFLFLFGENADTIAAYAAEAGFSHSRIFVNNHSDRPEDTANAILQKMKGGTRIVIKGAHGMRMERILHLLTEEMDGDKNA